jgi:hypothetical protein
MPQAATPKLRLAARARMVLAGQITIFESLEPGFDLQQMIRVVAECGDEFLMYLF